MLRSAKLTIAPKAKSGQIPARIERKDTIQGLSAVIFQRVDFIHSCTKSLICKMFGHLMKRLVAILHRLV